MTTRPSQDTSSKYYIHPSDTSSNQLVSVKFNGTGYNNWKRSMLLMLSIKNKLSFVNGTAIVPDVSSDEYVDWERCNDLVTAWILFNLDETIARSVLLMKTARAIWKNLEERFGYTSMTQLFSLEQKVSEIRQGNDSVSEFYTNLKTLWDNIDDVSPLPICSCGAQQLQESQRVIQFLMKLNDNYSVIRGNILMLNPLPNVTQVYRMISQEEHHKEFSTSQSQNSSDALAFAAERSSGAKYPNKNVPGKKQNQKPTYYCTHCKMTGHSIERCFKVHGYPPNFKPKEKRVAALSLNSSSAGTVSDDRTEVASPFSAEQYAQFIEVMEKQKLSTSAPGSSTSPGHALLAGKMCLLSSFSGEWILDSGSTDHITPHLDDLSNFLPVNDDNSYITIPDGRKIKVKHTGTVILNGNIILNGVLHVPDFHYRLISIQKLCQELNSTVLFTNSKCLLQDISQQKPQLHLGDLTNGLFTVHSNRTNSEKQGNSVACLSALEEAKLWHLRLGHLPFAQILIAL